MFITQCSNLYQSLPASVIYSWGLMGGIGRSGRQSSEILERNILDSHSWFLAAFPAFVVIQQCNAKVDNRTRRPEFLKIDRGVARISHHSKRSSVIVTEPIRETGPETPKTPKEGRLQWVRLWYHSDWWVRGLKRFTSNWIWYLTDTSTDSHSHGHGFVKPVHSFPSKEKQKRRRYWCWALGSSKQ